MKPHIEYDMPDALYRAEPGVSQSTLKALARSPAHYQHALTAKRKHSEAMLIGSIVHHLALTPLAPEFWAIKPEGIDLRTKGGKAWAASVGDADIIDTEQEDACHNAVAALLSHPDWKMPAHTEVSLFAEIEGVQCKGRLDALHDGWIYDIKTTQDARPSAFLRQAYSLAYHVQAAMYLELARLCGLEPKGFVFFAVEVEPPNGCVAYPVSADALSAGHREMVRLLHLHKHCTETGEWPAYDPAPVMLTLPAWAKGGM
jgi:exodeoxyribonuclease VIII